MRVLTLLAVIALAQPPHAAPRVELITTGPHHGDEVPADTPGVWFALVADPGGASLHRVRVTVAAVKDEIVDEGSETTGRRVDISPALDPIALVRGIPGLEAAPVPTVFVNTPIERDITARFGSRSYRFSIRCQDRPAVEGQRQERCDLTLRSGSQAKVLFEYLAYYEGAQRVWGSENTPTILWAGDLNGDHRLDVLLETSNHYNVDEMRLYVSDAGSGTVSEVAVYTTVGC